MEYFVYILESEIDGRLYKGQTSDIAKRIIEHNSGKTKSTKDYKPWKLVYLETFGTRDKQFFVKNISKQEVEENF